MKTHRLGGTGLKVTELCLGTMTFGHQCDEATSAAIMDRAFAGGVTFFDTADMYPIPSTPETAGRTEEFIGRWLPGKRDQIVLATKCRHKIGHGPNEVGLSRKHILRACEDSLRRLGTDYIDLYQAHSPDPDTPLDETLEALDSLVRQGKVRYLGCSNYSAWETAVALGISDRRGWERWRCVQPRYNLLHRDIETELLPLCRAQGLGCIVYNPLAGGMLSGKYKSPEDLQPGTRFTLGGVAGELYRKRYWHQAQIDAVKGLQTFFGARGRSLVSVAVAWVLAQPGVTSAIVGATRPEQLDASIDATTLALDDEERHTIDAVWYSLPRGQPASI